MNKTPLILVVDDEEIIRNILAKLINSLGYRSLQAANGSDALDMLNRHQPDLVLLDIVMPGIASSEVIKKIRQNPEHNGIAIIMISGADNLHEIAAHIQIGADDFLLKPFNSTLFKARIKNGLGRLSHLQEKRQLQSELAESRLLLQQAESSTEDFCSLLAHDLNNTVTGIIMSAELLQLEVQSEKTKKGLNDIMDSAEQIPVMIKQRRKGIKDK